MDCDLHSCPYPCYCRSTSGPPPPPCWQTPGPTSHSPASLSICRRCQPPHSQHVHLQTLPAHLHLGSLSSVQFLQLVCIFTDLVLKILLDVFKCHIKLSKAFEVTFPTKQWDGGLDHREWLASMMKKAKAQDFTRKAVKEKLDTEWDVSVLSTVMNSLDVCCDDAMTKACDKVRQSRNALYHRCEAEVSHDEFTQCIGAIISGRLSKGEGRESKSMW